VRKLIYGLIAVIVSILPASAQVRVGIIVSATGPAASVGVTQQRTVGILPQTLGGQPVQHILLDDASDTSTAVKHARKLILEDKVDVIVGPSLTPNSLAALPQTTLAERGYRGVVYQTHGVANNDFLRVGGKALEGTFVPAGPVLVAEQLPDDHPAKGPALDFIRRSEALPGAGARSTFAAYLWDAQLILNAAITTAVKTSPPGTDAFRAALTVIGGSGQVWGAILGAGLVTLLKQELQDFLRPFFGATTRLEMLLFAGLMILTLARARRGVWPFIQQAASPFVPSPSAMLPRAMAGTRQMPEQGTQLLVATNMRRRFGGLVAVDDVSFDVRAGEVLGLSRTGSW